MILLLDHTHPRRTVQRPRLRPQAAKYTISHRAGDSKEWSRRGS